MSEANMSVAKMSVAKTSVAKMSVVLVLHYLIDFLAIFLISLEFFIFSVYGHLPSELIFLFTQLYSVLITLFIGVLNVSSFLQVCLITNTG